MEPEIAYNLLRAAIPKRPELRWRSWPIIHSDQEDQDLYPYRFFCYIATEVFCHLVHDAKPHSHDRDHFWAQIKERIFDPTFDQFPDPYPYELGSPTRFKQLSKRATALLEECLSIRSTTMGPASKR